MIRKSSVAMLLLFATALFTLVPFALGEQQKYSARQSLGFKGQVHTALTSHTKLAKDPRTRAHIFIFPVQSWLSFDAAGNLMEVSGQEDANGRIEGVQRMQYDAEGRQILTATYVNGQEIDTRNEYLTNADGTQEMRVYSGGKLQNRTVGAHDALGRVTESNTFDGASTLINHAVWKYDEEGRVQEWTVEGANKQLAVHFLDHYEGEDGLVRSGLDPAGHIVWTLSMQGGTLTHSWSDTSCSPPNDLPAWCRGSLGWIDQEKGVIRGYRFDDDGLLDTVENRSGQHGNLEPDSAEVYDSSGKLLEKVAYEYERDAEGNWTRRSVSVWDAGNNVMVPILEERRTITYY
jgi:hypothetical protein